MKIKNISFLLFCAISLAFSAGACEGNLPSTIFSTRETNAIMLTNQNDAQTKESNPSSTIKLNMNAEGNLNVEDECKHTCKASYDSNFNAVEYHDFAKQFISIVLDEGTAVITKDENDVVCVYVDGKKFDLIKKPGGLSYINEAGVEIKLKDNLKLKLPDYIVLSTTSTTAVELTTGTSLESTESVPHQTVESIVVEPATSSIAQSIATLPVETTGTTTVSTDATEVVTSTATETSSQVSNSETTSTETSFNSSESSATLVTSEASNSAATVVFPEITASSETQTIVN